MDTLIGKSILHYRIVRQLGAGGMGVVYEAEDTRLGRHVALKFLSKDIEQDKNALERFQQEARAASALNHPNICTIYAIEECDGQHFIAMELLEGQSLNEKINGHPLPVDKIIDIGIQITDASRCGAQQRHCASRLEARQHLHHDAGTGEDTGFRAGKTGL